MNNTTQVTDFEGDNAKLAAHLQAVIELDAKAPEGLRLIETDYCRTLLLAAICRLTVRGPDLMREAAEPRPTWAEGWHQGHDRGYELAIQCIEAEAAKDRNDRLANASDVLSGMAGVLRHDLEASRRPKGVGLDLETRHTDRAALVTENAALHDELAELRAENDALRQLVDNQRISLDAALGAVVAQPVRSDADIVAQTEQLARRLAQHDGFETSEHMMPFRSAANPRMQQYWAHACLAQEVLTQTDVANALANLDEIPF